MLSNYFQRITADEAQVQSLRLASHSAQLAAAERAAKERASLLKRGPGRPS
jgi:hypothetical protein